MSEIICGELRKAGHHTFAQYVEAEAKAHGVVEVVSNIIPGLLQLPDYIDHTPASALMKKSRRVRQESFRQNGQRHETIMSESALYRRMGGLSVEAMVKQLAFLYAHTQSPYHKVLIAPRDGPYTHLDVMSAITATVSKRGTSTGIACEDIFHPTLEFYSEDNARLRMFDQRVQEIKAAIDPSQTPQLIIKAMRWFGQ